MTLTLDEAAVRLGKSVRQIRYMIKTGSLTARKVTGRWVVEADALPLSGGQQRARERKERELRAAVEEGLELAKAPRQPRYSVRDLKAFQIALPLFHKASENLGAEHSATRALRQVIEHLTRGCHRYDYGEKANAYRDARDAASLAVCELVLVSDDHAEPLVKTIEQELMAAFAGLLRRLHQALLRARPSSR